MTDLKLLVLHNNMWKHWTVCKQMINSKENCSYYIGFYGVSMVDMP